MSKEGEWNFERETTVDGGGEPSDFRVPVNVNIEECLRRRQMVAAQQTIA